MKVANRVVKNGQLISITAQLEGTYEREGFKKLPGMQTCPHCGKPIDPKDEEMMIIIPTPLQQTIPGAALELGVALTRCSACGETVQDTDQCDLMSFPEIMTYVTGLRRAYQAAAAKKKGGAKGGQKG
ncbi:MAG: hypothetical protein NC131_18145 [Roseburia sp.]|nr:hypothetical protein [Roseburia sp.]